MELREAIRHAIDGEAILFLGAGFSSGGKNKRGEDMKVGAGLSRAICADLGIEASDNLTISATRYIHDDSCKKGLPAFIRFLKEEVGCVETSAAQDMIAALPWKRIYTTNYDDIIELSSEKQGIQRESVTITNIRYAVGRNLEQAVMHINGYVKRLDEATFFEEFKITDDNYNRDGLLQSSWKELFETDLRREKAIIFVGYSLQYDQELVRLIANLDIKKKCIFIDVPTISGDNEFKIKLYGELYKIGASGLADEIQAVKDEGYTAKIKHKGFIGFEKKDLSAYYSESHYSSVDVIDLLVKGDLKTEFINQEGYCLQRRDRIEEAKGKLRENKVLILLSKLGNGKSIFLECLACSLLEDYDVYLLKDMDSYIEDIQLMQSVPDVQNVLLIDDYGHYMQLLKALGKDFPENLKLVLTCRTSININLYYDLTEKFHYCEDDIDMLELDDMTDSEIYELVKMFDENRLWGPYDTLSTAQKKRKIKKDHDANLSQVFYLLMNSEPIRDQIKFALQVLERKMELKGFVLAQAINSLCKLKFGYSDLCKFVRISDSLLRNYSMDKDVREIVDVENHRFILSSSIFSRYLVRQGDMKREMIDMLGKLYTECSDNDEWSKKYIVQRKFLISRSNIKLVFSQGQNPSEAEEREIYSYYDGIKNLTTATDNPFFWLQFGITSLNLEQYEIAKIYLDNAYANADKIDDFDSYQIDTQYARMLLCNEMCTNRNNKADALDSFYKAHRLLYQSSNRGMKLSYILKQASLYTKYLSCYKQMMSEEEMQRFFDTAFEMAERFSSFFRLRDLKEVPIDVALAYREYRKLFNGTPYILPLKAIDEAYNLKTKKRKLRV